jgi:hypothetical protein
VTGRSPRFFAGLGFTLGLALLLTSPALADDELQSVRDAENRFELKAPASWTRKPTSDQHAPLLILSGTEGQRLTVSRINHPNLAAWKKKKHFFEQVVRGLAANTQGFRLRRQKRRKAGLVPVLELAFYRKGKLAKESVWMRFLFFRRYTIVAVSALPANAKRSLRLQANRAVDSLQPYFKAD